MVLRKITIDNSVRYIPKSERTKETDITPKKMKAGSLPRQQKNSSQNNNIFLKNISEQGFKYPK